MKNTHIINKISQNNNDFYKVKYKCIRNSPTKPKAHQRNATETTTTTTTHKKLYFYK